MNKFKRTDDAQPLLRLISLGLYVVGAIALAIALMELLK